MSRNNSESARPTSSNLIPLNKFNIDLVTVTPITFAKDKKTNGYLNYGDPSLRRRLYTQCNSIKLTSFGIPKLGTKHVKTDNDREFIRIPNDPAQPNCTLFFDYLKQLDEFMVKPSTVKKLFEQNPKLLEGKVKPIYEPCVRQIISNEPDKEDSVEYLKLCFLTEWDKDDNEVHRLLTDFYIIDSKDKTKKTLHPMESMTEVFEEISFLSTVRFTNYVQRVTYFNGKYSLKFFTPRLEYAPNTSFGKMTNEELQNSEGEDLPPAEELADSGDAIHLSPAKMTFLKNKQTSNSDEDEEPEEKSRKQKGKAKPIDSDSEEEPPKKSKGKAKPIDSDQEEESDEVPKKKKSSRKVKPIDSDDDEVSEEKPKKKKNTRK